jgi:hypothetical protein
MDFLSGCVSHSRADRCTAQLLITAPAACTNRRFRGALHGARPCSDLCLMSNYVRMHPAATPSSFPPYPAAPLPDFAQTLRRRRGTASAFARSVREREPGVADFDGGRQRGPAIRSCDRSRDALPWADLCDGGAAASAAPRSRSGRGGSCVHPRRCCLRRARRPRVHLRSRRDGRLYCIWLVRSRDSTLSKPSPARARWRSAGRS